MCVGSKKKKGFGRCDLANHFFITFDEARPNCPGEEGGGGDARRKLKITTTTKNVDHAGKGIENGVGRRSDAVNILSIQAP